MDRDETCVFFAWESNGEIISVGCSERWAADDVSRSFEKFGPYKGVTAREISREEHQRLHEERGTW